MSRDKKQVEQFVETARKICCDEDPDAFERAFAKVVPPKRPSGLTKDEKAALKSLKRLFWTDWDPIGCGIPDDEYDTYAIRAFGLLKNGSSVDELADYLTSVEVDEIGLTPVSGSKERNITIAKAAAKIVAG